MKDQQAANKKRKAEADLLWVNRKPEIEWLYNNQGMSQGKIADYYQVSQTAIYKAMKRLNIQPHSRGNLGQRNGRYKDGTESTLYRQMIIKDKCSICGATEKLIIHHKNGNHVDNHLENLQVLCKHCHDSLTRTLWWEKRKE